MSVKHRLLVVLLFGGCEGDSARHSIPDAAPNEIVTRTEALQPGEVIDGVFTVDGEYGEASTKIHLTAPRAELHWSIDDGSGAPPVLELFEQMTVDHPFVPKPGRWYLHVRNGGSTSIDIEARVELYVRNGGTLAFAWQ